MECACGIFVVPTYHTVRNHNKEEYNTNSYNHHDNSKSQPSTYFETNLWTSKAVAVTVLEMWRDCSLQVSGEVGPTVGMMVLVLVGEEFF